MDDRFSGVVYILAEKVERDGVTTLWSPLRSDDGTPEMFHDGFVAKYLCQVFQAVGRPCEVLTLNLADETPLI